MPGSVCLEPVPWETRNLGVESFAVSQAFFTKPDERTLARGLAALRRSHGNFFVQARFSPDTKTSQILEAQGFYFVQTTVSPHATLSRLAPLQRFVSNPSYVLPRRYHGTELDVTVLAAEHREMAADVRTIAGTSFVDDRFHIDHNCDSETASQRYQLWVDDLFRDHTARFHVLLRKSEAIAFLASRRGDLRLAGFARRYARSGLGEFFWLQVLQDLRLDGVNVVRTVISANSTAALNLYARLGFKFTDPRSTFHLWAGR